jgi:hypothetical protein
MGRGGTEDEVSEAQPNNGHTTSNKNILYMEELEMGVERND